MKLLSKNAKYIFIFLFSFLCMSFFLAYFDGDVLWNYGFSYAISRGEIPYVDFNMILTPFYPFLMSILFHVFGNHILVFYIENSFIITILFYLLFQLYGQKAWLFLLLLVFPIPAIVFPTYNLFLLFLLVLLLYLEKKESNDYLIGFIIGLSILTKQTVGFCLFLPSLYYLRKDIKKVGKRLIGCFIPILLFVIYLCCSGSFLQFLDLCLFGLLDFTEGNGRLFSLSFIIFFLLVFVLFVLKRKRFCISWWYILCFYSISIPLFDIPHLEFFFFAICLLLIEYFFIPVHVWIKQLFLFVISFVIIFYLFTIGGGKIYYPNHYHNFQWRNLNNQNGEFLVRDQLISYINKNKDEDEDIVILASDAYFYKIVCNMNIDSFDLLNKGNHGYHGTEKLKKKLDKLDKGTIFIIDTNEVYSKSTNSLQFHVEVAKYAIDMGTKIKKIGGYTIYRKN